jgi:predicted metal-dependent phosphoesterase TrpH
MSNRRFVDLHTHSTASDGSLPPAEVVRLADRANLAAVALTDHDTVAGIEEARRAARDLPEIVLVPGIEISAIFRKGTLHILGLGIDPASPRLAQMMATLQHARATRNPRILQKLADMGMALSMEDVVAAADELKRGLTRISDGESPSDDVRNVSAGPISTDSVPANSCLSPFVDAGERAGREKGDRHKLAGNVDPGTASSLSSGRSLIGNSAGANSSQSPFSRILGRVHIAMALVHKGYVKTKQEAFDRCIGRGQPAYVDKERLSPHNSIQAIHDAGGLAVLAHPPQLRYENDAQFLRILRDLIHAGLDGIEAFHSDNDVRQTRLYLDLAKRFDLGITGGSDFHGAGKPAVLLGKPSVPIEAMGEKFTRKLGIK